jgi:hypothetical protein
MRSEREMVATSLSTAASAPTTANPCASYSYSSASASAGRRYNSLPRVTPRDAKVESSSASVMRKAAAGSSPADGIPHDVGRFVPHKAPRTSDLARHVTHPVGQAAHPVLLLARVAVSVPRARLTVPVARHALAQVLRPLPRLPPDRHVPRRVVLPRRFVVGERLHRRQDHVRAPGAPSRRTG